MARTIGAVAGVAASVAMRGSDRDGPRGRLAGLGSDQCFKTVRPRRLNLEWETHERFKSVALSALCLRSP